MVQLFPLTSVVFTVLEVCYTVALAFFWPRETFLQKGGSAAAVVHGGAVVGNAIVPSGYMNEVIALFSLIVSILVIAVMNL